MRQNNKTVLTVITASLILSACASTPPKVAVNKTYNSAGEKLILGGVFYPDKAELVLTVNDDPIMKGTFPPYTPTQNIEGKYKNIPISAHCYFGSVLTSKKGKFAIVAALIQSKKGVTADKCEISVKSELAETLYF